MVVDHVNMMFGHQKEEEFREGKEESDRMGKGKWEIKRAQGWVCWASLRPSTGNQILMVREYHRIPVKPYSTRRLMVHVELATLE